MQLWEYGGVYLDTDIIPMPAFAAVLLEQDLSFVTVRAAKWLDDMNGAGTSLGVGVGVGVGVEVEVARQYPCCGLSLDSTPLSHGHTSPTSKRVVWYGIFVLVEYGHSSIP